MSIVINTNTAASLASYNLSSTNVNLQRSLQRLSSGSRINSSFDDAGGLAVSMKLSATAKPPASSDGLTILDPLESRLRLFCSMELEVARLLEAMVAV